MDVFARDTVRPPPQLSGSHSADHLGNAAHVLPRIFEPTALYLEHNSRRGFWGPPTSTIDWCEHNYVHSYFVAEYYNTLSNALFVLLGLLGIAHVFHERHEARFALLFFGVFSVGLGSTCFHATLTLAGQQGDETPMLLTLLVWIFCLLCTDPAVEETHPRRCRGLRVGLVTAGVIWTVLHARFAFVFAFQALFGAAVTANLALLLVEVRRCCDRDARRLGVSVIAIVALATVAWLLDQVLCVALYDLPMGLPSPQLHAVWHLLMGCATFVAPVFLIHRRLERLGRAPRIHWILGLIPVVFTSDQLCKHYSDERDDA